MVTPLCPVCKAPVVCNYRSVEGEKLVLEELECPKGHYKLTFNYGKIQEWECAECRDGYRDQEEGR